LNKDLNTLKHIEKELEQFKADMLKDFEWRRQRIDNLLFKMGERGKEYIDDTLKITKFWELMNKAKVKYEFNSKVSGDTIAEIEQLVSEIVDWLVERSVRQWSRIVDYLNFSARDTLQSNKDIVGRIQSNFSYNRSQLLEGLGSSASRVVASHYNKEKEAETLSAQVKAAVYQTAVFELGAVGIGTLMSAAFLDLTGILPLTAIAATGLAVLPYRRAQVKRALHEKIESMRITLQETLMDHFTKELETSINDIIANISPFQHFVTNQQQSIDNAQESLKSCEDKAAQISQLIDQRFPIN